ncbi:CGNR zinc finger domain-containing protein [Actinophytocola oryzae]|uniref:Putative stress-induced transcription regulator n=1 Tax=Actinophytocola oryzae TaxID=502181 RepID=A0A4R7UPB3_9PSEU|nr:CGNR zinc finger domain-containing protein [Actinophytocola oryzae]TDV34920.1 putative stress-induced transcription regulator [Actinophytocola oryzae]
MHLNPYGEDPVRLAVDLVNYPPRTPAELGRRCAATGVAVDAVPTASDLQEVERFLALWLGVVDAESAEVRAERLNRLLAQSSTHPRLTDHADDGWHLHYRDPDLPLGGVIRALVSVGTALHLTGRGMTRLRRCALEECRSPFGDFSRGGRQRYCSPACANRDAVRRHRAKKPA